MGGHQLTLAADAQMLADIGAGHLHRRLSSLRNGGRQHLVDRLAGRRLRVGGRVHACHCRTEPKAGDK